MRKYLLILLLVLPLGYAAITCSIDSGTTCSSSTKLLGLENDTGGGLTNAHAQNATINTYAYSLCCSTNLTDTLTTSCSKEVFAKLSDTDNAHVQSASTNTYSVDACIGYETTEISCAAVNRSCYSNESCIMSMSDYDNAHAASCETYDINICCTEANAAPSVPVLIEPDDDNLSVFERYPFFDWEDSTDPQADPITYEVNITAPAGCAALPNYNVSNSNYTSSEELCVDSNYTWTVRACDDSDACSAYATPYTFQIASVVGVQFSTNTSDFGNLNPSIPGENSTEDTLDDSPGPLVINNTGNVRINTSVRALSDLWDTQGLNTTYFQYADEDSSAWQNVSDTYRDHTGNLSYAQQRELEIRLWVPIGEPGGDKTTTVQALGVSIE